MPRRAALVLVLIALAAGCDSGDERSSQSTAAAASPDVTTAATGVRLDRIATFDTPVYAIGPPGDPSRLFVVEQGGRIRLVRNGQAVARPFLDIRSDVESGGERGLLSMAFAPDYRTSRRFYVYFTDETGDIRIQQFRRSKANADVAVRSSRRNVLRVGHRTYGNHNGGQLQTGPDGMLYAGFGDGGGAGDPFGSGQSLKTLLAKLIRIDPRPGGGYRVPSSNPFADRSGVRREIWAYGLRNPFRFSFDRKTGALTIGDVGQNEFEEIDFAPHRGRGANWGWSVWEGFSRYGSGTAPHARKPVLAPSHDDGFCALIGGYVVRDKRLGSLYGRYVYGDNCVSRIFSVRLASDGAHGNRATSLSLSNLSSFGEDSHGRVYATSLGGGVYRLEPK
ncbi:MAG TPA: PQQ-dependent sugar dehydrogenase [Thermoleophilaceae bacterium]|nr:PQQ-dependent sugar dehydrogenase [Thermoleophilaceae bacterium]